MSKYTMVGPWEVSPTGYRVSAVKRDAQGIVTDFHYICDTANNKATRTPENAANAKLIAAAPDMAEALLELKDTLLSYDGHVTDPLAEFGWTNKDARAAYIKAEAALKKAGL